MLLDLLERVLALVGFAYSLVSEVFPHLVSDVRSTTTSLPLLFSGNDHGCATSSTGRKVYSWTGYSWTGWAQINSRFISPFVYTMNTCSLCTESLYPQGHFPLVCSQCFYAWCRTCALECLRSRDERCPFCRVQLEVQYTNLRLEYRLQHRQDLQSVWDVEKNPRSSKCNLIFK